jgi:hypothetical protein
MWGLSTFSPEKSLALKITTNYLKSASREFFQFFEDITELYLMY